MTALRIWHQSYSNLRELPGYVGWLTAHAASVLPEASVDFYGLKAAGGTSMTPEAKAHALVSAATTAEASGYDAFVLGCIYDPALKACRSAVSIPVLALAESVASLGAERQQPLGLLVLAPEEVDIVVGLMTAYGLSADEVAVEVVLPEVSELDLDHRGRNDDWSACEQSQHAANALRCRGYSQVVAAEGVLNEYLWSAIRWGQTHDIEDSVGWLWAQTRAAVQAGSPRHERDVRPVPNDAAARWFAATGSDGHLYLYHP